MLISLGLVVAGWGMHRMTDRIDALEKRVAELEK